MPKRDEKKPNTGARNDSRVSRTKKAYKKNGSRPKHTRSTLSAIDRVLLGKGLFDGVAKRWAQPIKIEADNG